MIATMGNRDFRLLWSGQLLSSAGSWLLFVAVPYRVFQLTGSPAATGLAFVAGGPATLLGPLAGVLVDRWDRRRTMLAADLGRAAAILPLLLVRGPDQLWLVYGALLAESLLGQLFDPAAQALVPALVGRGPELTSANALLSTIAAVSRLLGAPLGGAAFAAWGLPAVVLVDAGTYLVSAASLALLRWRPAGAADRARRAPDPLGGLRHLARSRPLRGILAVAAAFVAANGAYTALLVPDVRFRLHADAGALGLLLAATGAGFLVGAPAGRALLHRIGARAATSLSMLGTGLAFLVWFETDRLAVAVAAAVAAGACAVVFLVGRRTLVQRLTPDGLLGRVSATFLAMEATASLAGTALGGAGAGLAGVGPAAAGAAAVILASGLLAVLIVPDRDHSRPERIDQAVVTSAAAARDAASDALVERLRPLLAAAHRLAYGMLQGSHEAEDAVQEAIFKAWRARDRLRPGADLRPWFLKIVANECRQRLRRRWWSVVKRDEVPVPATPDPTAGWDDASDLPRALRSLPREQRLVLVLRYYLDLPLEEVAGALGISPGAARARVHRALGRLRMEVPER